MGQWQRSAAALAALPLHCVTTAAVESMLQIRLHHFDALAAHAVGCCLVVAPRATATSTRRSTRLLVLL